MSDVQKNLEQQANTYLANLESKNLRVPVQILSGSRAQHLETPVSDLDMFFIYIHPAKHYGAPFETTLEGESNETIWYQNYQLKQRKLDMWGWDVRKFIRLMAQSNLSALEAVNCPEDKIFRGNEFLNQIKDFFIPFFNFKKCAISYLEQAKNRASTKPRYEGGPVEMIQYKEYLQAARCVMNSMYLMRFEAFPDQRAPLLLESLKGEISQRDYDFIHSVFERRHEGGLLEPNFSVLFSEWFEPKYQELRTAIDNLNSEIPDIPTRQANEYFWGLIDLKA